MTGLARFFLPFAAMPWERVARGRAGQAYVPERTRQWKAAVRDTAAIAFARETTAPWRLDGRYSLHVIAGLPDWHTRDWDNVGKAVGDALKGIAWADDNQVTWGCVEKHVHEEGAGTWWGGELHRLYTLVHVQRLGDWPVKPRGPRKARRP